MFCIKQADYKTMDPESDIFCITQADFTTMDPESDIFCITQADFTTMDPESDIFSITQVTDFTTTNHFLYYTGDMWTSQPRTLNLTFSVLNRQTSMLTHPATHLRHPQHLLMTMMTMTTMKGMMGPEKQWRRFMMKAGRS